MADSRGELPRLIVVPLPSLRLLPMGQRPRPRCGRETGCLSYVSMVKPGEEFMFGNGRHCRVIAAVPSLRRTSRC
jgi:hypothetical protein